MTADHVVRRGEKFVDSVKVVTFDGTTYSAIIIGGNKYHDIAVLKIEEDYPYFEFASSSELVEGETVFAIGHPGALGTWIITKGSYLRTVQTRHVETVLTEFILTTDITRGGSSGSPVLNVEMKVVGVAQGRYGNSSESGDQLSGPQEIKVIEDLKYFEPMYETNAVSSDIASQVVNEILGW